MKLAKEAYKVILTDLIPKLVEKYNHFIDIKLMENNLFHGIEEKFFSPTINREKRLW
ncbi:hypothetical protein [Bacillus sp. J14TS2]|uniref:hypothetical protein n=1 Tax=Bacillus sp. J14TS2 TaxID=2807188 RepID=UPI001BB4551D|nr:hypothetical protein [Bacillus sp. J14TS2]